jgi:hypothetical protein
MKGILFKQNFNMHIKEKFFEIHFLNDYDVDLWKYGHFKSFKSP